MSFRITGTGSGVPACSKTNDDLAKIVETSDEWITTRTGIKSRYIMTTETLTELSVTAAQNALKMAGVCADELDLILVSTIRGDYLTPSLACVLQNELGAKCPAFDINAACSGFLYALDIADAYYARGGIEKVLVVSAEAMSKMLDWTDRSTCVLFGDGAGAAVLEKGDNLLSIKISASGNRDYLRIPNVMGNSPFSQDKQEPSYLYMNGNEVYKFAVAAMSNDLKEVIQKAGLTKEEVDYVLPHQANIRIIETARKRLGFPKEKVLVNIDRHGNTSSSCIPVLLDEYNRQGAFHDGDILALSAFGGGLTTGACVLRW